MLLTPEPFPGTDTQIITIAHTQAPGPVSRTQWALCHGEGRLPATLPIYIALSPPLAFGSLFVSFIYLLLALALPVGTIHEDKLAFHFLNLAGVGPV